MKSNSFILKIPMDLLGIFAILIFLMVIQPREVGFLKGHHGYVSGHTLAIASHMSLKSGGVGYTTEYSTSEGTRYEYFDRGPILTFGIIKAAMAFFDSKKNQILVARFLMIFICWLCISLTYFLVNKWFKNKILSLSTVLFSFSSGYAVYYSDFIAQENFTVLGMIILIWGIYLIEKKISIPGGIVLILLSVNLGWGYSQLPILGIWWLWHVFKHPTIKQVVHPTN